MSGKRQNDQGQLAFLFEAEGEARGNEAEGTETLRAERATENPAENQRLMEVAVDRENLRAALKRVRANAGSPGIDGMTVDALPEYLKQHWPSIREQLLSGTYEPQAVLRVEIEKTDGSGMRKLGIPTVLDRFIQQAVMQVLQGRWDPTFSEHSYGFRPGRSTRQAVSQAQEYIAEGAGGEAGYRFAPAKTHSGILECRGDGKRVGESHGGRGSARRPTFAPAVQPRAGRARPGVRATRSPLCSLCGRLQHLRSQRKGGEAGDGECSGLHHQPAQASGEQREKRGGEAAGA